jgi:hypothetical protein
MAALNLVKPGQAGAAPGLVAVAAGGDSFPIISRTQKFHFKNTDAAARNVTFVAQKKCNVGVLHNAIVNVPAGTERIVDDLDPAFFDDGNGRVQLTYDASANLTAGSYA